MTARLQANHSVSRIVPVVAFAGLLGLSACKTTEDANGNVVSSSDGQYNLFWDQGDHLKELVGVRKFEKAAELYAQHRAFFAADPEKYRPQLKIAADEINRPLEPGLKDAVASLGKIAWPSAPSVWESIRTTLAAAEKTQKSYVNRPLVSEDGFRAPAADDLKARLAKLKLQIENDAVTQFAAFDHFGDTAFFAAFPVELDQRRVFSEAFGQIRAKLEAAAVSDIERFAAHYPKEIIRSDDWRIVSDLYVGAAVRNASAAGNSGLPAVLAAVSAARKAGFQPSQIPGIKIAFVEVTSRTLLKHGQIEFPAEVVADLPVAVTKAELDDALTNPTASAADYLVVLDVAVAKTRRRISSTKKMPSKILTGHRTQANPDYNIAQNELNQSQIDLQRASLSKASTSSQYCYGLGCLANAFATIAAAAAEGSAREKVDQAMARLRATPMTIEIPIFESYRFDRASVRSAKTMTVHYYVIDRRAKRYFKSTFDVEERKNFEVAYSVHPNDPDRESILKSADTDEKVAAWEDAPSTVTLSQLVEHYLGNVGQAKLLPSIAALRQEMLKDKNTALAKFEATRFDARPLNDPRFDSVVVVYSKAKDGASLGSGFFVAPDVVMTNYHVVDGATFVELKMYDGQETFGKIVAQDAIRDLAIVKVQSRGKPVQFFTKRTVDLGATVEAIGHPRRLEFSITRGVISAVRKSRTVAIGGGGGKEVLFIQTDSPISPGNSGGPLFLGDRVVGVNTQGRTDGQGLNFSVHYSEVLDFLREHLPGFSVQAGG